ncbi:MAG: DUF4440 domain-containing protein [Bacteroidota bacterium]|nr:DUF4440 domain-containing protein [Bacteroidota bacterium]MDP4217417.1 DUF4440 domain-containing protein [Bacteroidota bacterium]MDP4255385.1 DUF4440 domain-containing protein [Bacteroidota bacterium]MDP4257264.1 DUF4440 domain-containing protein [Bacteroidota bacterium]
MKPLVHVIFILSLLSCGCTGRHADVSQDDREALKRTTAAIRDAFGRGDVDAILALHHPDVVKYFGGDNIMRGREGLRKQLTGWLRDNNVEFVENRIESTLFNEGTAVETSIFAIKSTPKRGGAPSIARGRSMVVYVRYKDSPTGWASIREVTQEAPAGTASH